jgi:hypothetical protein
MALPQMKTSFTDDDYLKDAMEFGLMPNAQQPMQTMSMPGAGGGMPGMPEGQSMGGYNPYVSYLMEVASANSGNSVGASAYKQAMDMMNPEYQTQQMMAQGELGLAQQQNQMASREANLSTALTLIGSEDPSMQAMGNSILMSEFPELATGGQGGGGGMPGGGMPGGFQNPYEVQRQGFLSQANALTAEGMNSPGQMSEYDALSKLFALGDKDLDRYNQDVSFGDRIGAYQGAMNKKSVGEKLLQAVPLIGSLKGMYDFGTSFLNDEQIRRNRLGIGQ